VYEIANDDLAPILKERPGVAAKLAQVLAAGKRSSNKDSNVEARESGVTIISQTGFTSASRSGSSSVDHQGELTSVLACRSIVATTPPEATTLF